MKVVKNFHFSKLKTKQGGTVEGPVKTVVEASEWRESCSESVRPRATAFTRRATGLVVGRRDGSHPSIHPSPLHWHRRRQSHHHAVTRRATVRPRPPSLPAATPRHWHHLPHHPPGPSHRCPPRVPTLRPTPGTRPFWLPPTPPSRTPQQQAPAAEREDASGRKRKKKSF